MLKRLFATGLLLAAAAVMFAAVGTDLSTPLPIDPELVIGTLPNGLTYYIKVNHKPEKRAELRLAVKTGSVQEDDDQQGLAHFTEHMAFNGTRHFAKSALVDYLSSIGMGYAAGLNAGTGMDNTIYQLKVPTDNPEVLNKAFLILSDWASGISFDHGEIAKERGVIIEEWRMGQGAEQRISDAQNKVILQGSRYGERMPIGKLEVLQNFQDDTIKRFYRDWYRPDLQAVIAVGDFDPVQVEDLIRKHFGDIPATPDARPMGLYAVPDHPEPQAVVVTDKEASETRVELTWLQPYSSVNNLNDYRQTLIENLYSQMFNQRLSELSQQAEPPFSYAYSFKYNMTLTKANYSIIAQVPESGIQKGVTALLTEAERVKRFGFTSSELERAKQTLLRNSERMLAEKDKQDSGRLVWRYVGHFIHGNPIMSIEQNVSLNKILYQGIALEEVNGLTNSLINDQNLVISASAPAKSDLVVPTQAELLALIPTVKTAALTPYEDNASAGELLPELPKPGKVVSEKLDNKLGIRQWKLSNGITVITKQTDFRNDEVLLRAFSPGGSYLYPAADKFNAQEAVDIVTNCGAGTFDNITLTKLLSGKIAEVNPYIYGNEEGFTANASVVDLETMFQLLVLYAVHPKRDEASLQSWSARTSATLENEALNPETAFSDSTYAIMYNRHPLAHNLKVSDIPLLNMDRVYQIYTDRFRDFSDFSFVIVGSFDDSRLKTLCTQYLATLPTHGRKDRIADPKLRFTQGKVEKIVYGGQDNKSLVQFVLNGKFSFNAHNRYDLQYLSLLLNEKLRENIREARSGVYFIGAWQNARKYPIPTYQISIYMQCSPERVEELSAAVIATLDSLRAGAFLSGYLDVVRNTRIKRLETDKKENRWWLNGLYETYWNRLSTKDLLSEDDYLKKLDQKKLQAIARKYLNHDRNLIRIVLYPADWERQ